MQGDDLFLKNPKIGTLNLRNTCPMGSYRIKQLEVTHEGAEKEFHLWSRGGLEGLEICGEEMSIHIPKELILSLLADEFRSKMVSRYEGMSNEDALREIFRQHRQAATH